MYKAIIVDDEPLTCEGLKRIITNAECNVNIVGIAYNGLDGINLVKELKPHFVIADIRMKGMNGLEMIKKLRNEGFNGEIIVISGYKVFEYAQEAIEWRVRHYLLKPITKEKLLSAIDNVVKSLATETDNINDEINDGSMMDKALWYIDKNYEKDISLSEVATQVFVSPKHLSRVFKAKMGINFIEYLTTKRIDRAKELLTETDLNVYQIASKLSYQDYKYFSVLFKKYTGKTPTDYRSENKNKKTD